MQIHFDPLTRADMPLLTRCLQEPHVCAFWDDGERDEATVRAHYLGDDRDDVPGFIFRVDGHPTGFLQTERITDGHEFQPWAAPVGETWAIDLLIGEPELIGQGLGPQVIRAFIGTLSGERPELRRIVIDPDQRNSRAIRAYAKAGFHKVGSLNGLTGPVQIMQLTVGPEGAVSVRDELSAAIDCADEPAIQRMIVANLLSMEDLVFGLTGSVISENVNLIHLFLDQGAEPNDLGQMYGFVPATLLAAESLNVEVIRAVFSHGGDPTVECAGGATPLLCLIEVMGLHGNVEMVEPVAALVELGADPEYCSPEARFTPLEMARGLRLESVAAYLEAVIRLGAAGDDTIEL